MRLPVLAALAFWALPVRSATVEITFPAGFGSSPGVNTTHAPRLGPGNTASNNPLYAAQACLECAPGACLPSPTNPHAADAHPRS